LVRVTRKVKIDVYFRLSEFQGLFLVKRGHLFWFSEIGGALLGENAPLFRFSEFQRWAAVGLFSFSVAELVAHRGGFSAVDGSNPGEDALCD